TFSSYPPQRECGGPRENPAARSARLQPAPTLARRAQRRADAGVAANALLTPHVFIGIVLIPPVLLKVASTGWRFARYYRGAPAYRRKGPPLLLPRLLGPVVVILTVVLLASGVGLLLVGPSWLPLLLKVHKASFVLWFGVMTIHVLGHLGEVFRL